MELVPINDNIVKEVSNKLSYFSNQILGKGSKGTIVCKGTFGKRGSVAVKQYNIHILNYFENEVNLLNTVDTHKNIIRYFDSETKANRGYLVLELCNATLIDYVSKTEKGKEVQGIKDIHILSDCISGINFIHEKNIVHRNITPSNILLLKQSPKKIVVKISGFGLGKKKDEDDELYNSELATGSYGWRSPEFLKIGATDFNFEAGVKSDIFSLGCLFYYVLTRGNHPYGAKKFRRPLNIKCGAVEMSSATEYDFRGATDLIKSMIDFSPDKRPPLSLVESHPLFWKSDKINKFFKKVNDEYDNMYDKDSKSKKYSLRTDVPEFVLNTFAELENFGEKQGLVFKKNWTAKARKKFNVCFNNYYNEDVIELIRCFRNYNEHRKSRKNAKHVGNFDEERYLNEWLKLYPTLLTCTWVVFKRLKDNSVKEFEEFYTMDCNVFWETERCKLINNDYFKM